MSCALAVVALTVGLIAAFGTPLWQDDGVGVSVALQSQLDPQIVSDGSSGAIVTWEDYRNSATTGYDIYAQRMDSNGNALWQTDGVSLCIASSSQSDPQIASDGSGGAIVTWEDQRDFGTTGKDIYARRVDGSGNALWETNGVSLSVALNDQQVPQIASDGSGGAVVTWIDKRDDVTTSQDIYVRRVDGNGNALWYTDGVTICEASNAQEYPQIASDGSGGAIVTWTDLRDDGGDIYAQRVYSDGTVAWASDGVSLCVDSNIQHDQEIVSDGSGGAIVTWMDYRDSQWDIYAQRVDSSGNALWQDDGVPLCSFNWHQQDPQIVSDGAGGAIVTWEDYRYSQWDIYAQRVDSSGNALWVTDGVSLCVDSNDQVNPRIAPDGYWGAIVTWRDERGSDRDIYAQRVGGVASDVNLPLVAKNYQ